MKISKLSRWEEQEIQDFLQSSQYPMRLSFLANGNSPQICSLWYEFEEGALWCVSHQNSFLIKQLKQTPQVSFEVSTNDYPYKGVRGKGEALLSKEEGDIWLKRLIGRYLKGGNASLSEWLLGRANQEYVIKITPTLIGSWDFSDRMES